MWVLSYKVLSQIYGRYEELTFYMQHTVIKLALIKINLINNCTANNVGKIEFKIDLGTPPTMYVISLILIRANCIWGQITA